MILSTTSKVSLQPRLLSTPLLFTHSVNLSHSSSISSKQCTRTFSHNYSTLLHTPPNRNVFAQRLFGIQNNTPFSNRRPLTLIPSRYAHGGGAIKRSAGQGRKQTAFLDSLETVVDPYVPEPFPSLKNPATFTRAVLRSWLNVYKNLMSNIIIRVTMKRFAKKEKNPEIKATYQGFSVKNFGVIAKNAYVEINEAMAKGDVGALKHLVTPRMLTRLSTEIALIPKGHTCIWKVAEFKKSKVVTIRMIKIGENNIKADFAQITVEIAAIQSIQVKNEKGNIVTSSGNVLVEEYWTFERQIQHPASTWRLLERRVKVNKNAQSQNQIESNKQ
eukprot:TRINITY_DN1350_c0_g1_i1.p1 TRINITY_DN1350_c0_g1~~TRINITY_DN1350_c0_g1_i1.p1  ORF type:complete len:330 (-),score=64.99 TRINITY_DN1350_c0_g1_i1:48-1037(-)